MFPAGRGRRLFSCSARPELPASLLLSGQRRAPWAWARCWWDGWPGASGGANGQVKFQTSNSKHERSSKSQAPNSKKNPKHQLPETPRPRLGWLEGGIWDLFETRDLGI